VCCLTPAIADSELCLQVVPGVALSSDFISGFCDETESEHDDTISLMEQVKFEQAFMFAYSMRDKTHAYHRMEDNVPEDVKNRRLQEVGWFCVGHARCACVIFAPVALVFAGDCHVSQARSRTKQQGDWQVGCTAVRYFRIAMSKWHALTGLWFRCGREHVLLVEGTSKRSTPEAPALVGRVDNGKRCIIPGIAPLVTMAMLPRRPE